jgi:hypothetical protein
MHTKGYMTYDMIFQMYHAVNRLLSDPLLIVHHAPPSEEYLRVDNGNNDLPKHTDHTIKFMYRLRKTSLWYLTTLYSENAKIVIHPITAL